MENLAVAADRGEEFIAAIGFAPAFVITLEYGEVHSEITPRGTRIFRKITGGSVSGRIEGSVYPQGAGQYSRLRSDGVTDVGEHILVRDAKGEWLYIRNLGFQRSDGYHRVTAWVDADARGDHNWVLGLFFVGKVEPLTGNTVRLTYCEVL